MCRSGVIEIFMTNYGAGELLNGFIEFFLSSNQKGGNLGLASIKRGIFAYNITQILCRL